MSEQNDVPMIPKHQAETVIMYMSWAVKKVVTISIAAFVTIIVAIAIFVRSYNTRTEKWLDTLTRVTGMPAAEVTDGIYEQPAP